MKGKKWLLEEIRDLHAQYSNNFESIVKRLIVEQIQVLVEQMDDTRTPEEAVKDYFTGVELSKNLLEENGYVVEQPKMVIIPKFVADHIEMLKESGESLLCTLGLMKLGGAELINWINQDGNDEIFCKAWMDGNYTVSPKFDVKEGDWVIDRDAHSHDIRVVEACDIDVDDEFAGILLVNGIMDEYYGISELDEFYKKYRLFVKKENLEEVV